MAELSERESEGTGQPNARCSECTNLNPGDFCTALKRTVSGSRHLRVCPHFQQGTPNPLPVRPGNPQPPDLVQCSGCEWFAGWGRCAAGVGEISGELGSRIWRWCDEFLAAEPTGSCSTCRYLVKQVCMISGFPVTCPDQPSSCRKYCTNQNP